MARVRAVRVRVRGRGGSAGWNVERIGICKTTTRSGEGFGPRKNWAVRIRSDMEDVVVGVVGSMVAGSVAASSVMASTTVGGSNVVTCKRVRRFRRCICRRVRGAPRWLGPVRAR